MRVTVLGKSPSWQDAGGACSGYLLQDDGVSVLIDCGNGVFSKLRQFVDYTEVDAVVLSHLHADHFLDLVPFAYGLTLPPGERRRPTLHLPPGGAAELDRITTIWGSDGLVAEAFEINEYERAASLELGPLEARLHPVPHFAETHAVELRSPGGGSLLYGSDCRAGEEIVAAAEGVDVLVAEATLPASESRVPVAERGHMSAADAGAVAADAGVGSLILTHFSDMLDPVRLLADAGERFDGPVELARGGLEVYL